MTSSANRTLWTIVGLVLTAAGVVGVLVSRGWLPGADRDAPLLWPALLEWWRDIDPWGLVGVGLLGLVVAVLGLILLASELRRRAAPALDELRLARERPGTTRVRGSAVGHGLERDLARNPGIRDAAVAITGTAPRPDLWIRLDVEQQADLATIRKQVGGALDRFSRTYGLHPRRLDVTARVVGAPPPRVR
jgi:hypothetical protein